METSAEISVISKPSVSCKECSQTTQILGGMKLHVKNNHIISQDQMKKLFALMKPDTFVVSPLFIYIGGPVKCPNNTTMLFQNICDQRECTFSYPRKF